MLFQNLTSEDGKIIASKLKDAAPLEKLMYIYLYNNGEPSLPYPIASCRMHINLPALLLYFCLYNDGKLQLPSCPSPPLCVDRASTTCGIDQTPLSNSSTPALQRQRSRVLP